MPDGVVTSDRRQGGLLRRFPDKESDMIPSDLIPLVPKKASYTKGI